MADKPPLYNTKYPQNSSKNKVSFNNLTEQINIKATPTPHNLYIHHEINSLFAYLFLVPSKTSEASDVSRYLKLPFIDSNETFDSPNEGASMLSSNANIFVKNYQLLSTECSTVATALQNTNSVDESVGQSTDSPNFDNNEDVLLVWREMLQAIFGDFFTLTDEQKRFLCCCFSRRCWEHFFELLDAYKQLLRYRNAFKTSTDINGAVSTSLFDGHAHLNETYLSTLLDTYRRQLVVAIVENPLLMSSPSYTLVTSMKKLVTELRGVYEGLLKCIYSIQQSDVNPSEELLLISQYFKKKLQNVFHPILLDFNNLYVFPPQHIHTKQLEVMIRSSFKVETNQAVNGGNTNQLLIQMLMEDTKQIARLRDIIGDKFDVLKEEKKWLLCNNEVVVERISYFKWIPEAALQQMGLHEEDVLPLLFLSCALGARGVSNICMEYIGLHCPSIMSALNDSNTNEGCADKCMKECIHFLPNEYIEFLKTFKEEGMPQEDVSCTSEDACYNKIDEKMMSSFDRGYKSNTGYGMPHICTRMDEEGNRWKKSSYEKDAHNLEEDYKIGGFNAVTSNNKLNEIEMSDVEAEKVDGEMYSSEGEGYSLPNKITHERLKGIEFDTILEDRELVDVCSPPPASTLEDEKITSNMRHNKRVTLQQTEGCLKQFKEFDFKSFFKEESKDDRKRLMVQEGRVEDNVGDKVHEEDDKPVQSCNMKKKKMNYIEAFKNRIRLEVSCKFPVIETIDMNMSDDEEAMEVEEVKGVVCTEMKCNDGEEINIINEEEHPTLLLNKTKSMVDLSNQMKKQKMPMNRSKEAASNFSSVWTPVNGEHAKVATRVSTLFNVKRDGLSRSPHIVPFDGESDKRVKQEVHRDGFVYLSESQRLTFGKTASAVEGVEHPTFKEKMMDVGYAVHGDGMLSTNVGTEEGVYNEEPSKGLKLSDLQTEDDVPDDFINARRLEDDEKQEAYQKIINQLNATKTTHEESAVLDDFTTNNNWEEMYMSTTNKRVQSFDGLAESFQELADELHQELHELGASDRG